MRRTIPLAASASAFLLMSLLTLIAYAQNVLLSDSFHMSDSINVPQKIIMVDLFHMSDTLGNVITNALHAFADAFHMLDAWNLGSIVTTVYTTVTDFVTVLGQSDSCGAQNCFTMGDAYTTVVIPALIIVVTGFGFMYMGVKSFGVFILVESFVLLMLSLLQIIPSYFTLLIILLTSAALTKMVVGFFRGGGSAV
jgi:hypothetical protein